MKSGKILLIVLFSFINFSLNAQFFVGGNIGLHTTGGTNTTGTTSTDRPSSLSFNFSPKAGYFFSDKLAVGAAIDVSVAVNTTPGTQETVSSSLGFGFSPFLRYYAVKFNKFYVFGQGTIGLSLSNSSTKVGSVTTDGPQVTGLSFGITPGLAYDLSDKISLETSLNFLNLGYTFTSSEGSTTTVKTSKFDVGAGLSNIVTLGTITVGAIFKF
jgi:outer membrane protein